MLPSPELKGLSYLTNPYHLLYGIIINLHLHLMDFYLIDIGKSTGLWYYPAGKNHICRKSESRQKSSALHKCQAVFLGDNTLLPTNSSPLKIGRAPKGNDCIPTIHFQVFSLAGFVAGMVCDRSPRKNPGNPRGTPQCHFPPRNTALLRNYQQSSSPRKGMSMRKGNHIFITHRVFISPGTPIYFRPFSITL